MDLRWGPLLLIVMPIVMVGSLSFAGDLRPQDIEKARQEFWAFQPISNPTVPDVNGGDALSPIDRFIRTRLAEAKLAPADPADRATLIRRLTYDLTGLPPTVDEIDAFVQDQRPDAYERLVDRLLASPRFGERWGRHWLDVARFAESSGGGRSFMLPDAWRFRDYVIDSINADKPLDRFIIEHIAGDLMPHDNAKQRAEQLTGAGFLALGAHNYEQQDKELLRMDVIDEQIATVGRAFMGMTLDCARCHDHKFDPVPMTDYYALAGIFRSTETLEVTTKVQGVSKWATAKLPMSPDAESKWNDHRAAVAATDKQIASLKNEIKQATGTAPSDAGGIVQPRELPGIVVDNRQAKRIGKWKDSTHFRTYVGAGYIHDDNQGDGEKSVIFTTELPKAGEYEIRMSYTPGGGRAATVPIVIQGVGVAERVVVDQRPVPPIDGLFVSLGRFDFEAGPASVTIHTHDTTGYVIADAVQFLPSDFEPVAAAPKPTTPDPESLKSELRKLELSKKKLAGSAPPGPVTVMSVGEQKDPGDWHLHKMGLAHERGPIVPRGFLIIAAPLDADGKPIAATIPEGRSGRLELAEWIASADNPLTARVLVNRIWQKLIGEGIVRSVDNFGTTGTPPTHPELLDHLATTFVADGWSLKKTVRRIVTSRTYRMSSNASTEALETDPENRLLAYAHRKPIEAEAMRDAMLSVSGELDPTMYGRTITKVTLYDLGYKHDTKVTRRSVYLPMFRNAVRDDFAVFDAATPNIPIGHRPRSVLPTQSLYLLNAPEMEARAAAAAKRLLADTTDTAEGINLLYRRTLGRSPTPREAALAARMIGGAEGDERTKRWTMLTHALFASIDFRYLD